MKNLQSLLVPVTAVLLAACGGQQTPDEPVVITDRPTTVVDSTDSDVQPSQLPADSETQSVEDGSANAFVEDSRIDTLYGAVEDAVGRARGGDLASARTDLQQLLGEPEVAAYALYGLGVIAFYEGQEASALDYFDQAMVSDPTLVDPLIAAIRIYLHHSDVSGARMLLQRQLSAADDIVQVRAAELYISLYEGRYDRVISDGRAMLLEDPANLDIHFAMGMANFYLERYELARYIMTISIERDSERPDFYFLLAMIDEAQGNASSMESWLNRVITIDANHPEALNNLGVLALRARHWDEALDYFQRASTHAPDYREAWLNMGNAYKGMGELDQAQASFEHAIAIDADYADPYFNLGILYLDAEMGELTRQERCQRAIDYFADYRSHVASVSSDDRVIEYAEQAATCVQTEIDLLEQEAQAEREAEEAAAAAAEAGTCMDDFGFECFPGDPDCFAPDGSVCEEGSGGGGGCTDDFGFECFPGDPDCFDALGNTCEQTGTSDSGGGCTDDFGFECFPGDPDCFDALGNTCIDEAGLDSGGSSTCTDDFGFECFPGDPDCFETDGTVCGGGSTTSPEPDSTDGGCLDDFGFDCLPGDPECYDPTGAPCGGSQEPEPATETPNEPATETPNEQSAPTSCFDDFGFECSPGDPECYASDGNPCGGGANEPASDAPTTCFDDFGFECSPGDPECYDTNGNPCE